MLQRIMQVTSLLVSDLLPYSKSLTVLRDSFLNHRGLNTKKSFSFVLFVTPVVQSLTHESRK